MINSPIRILADVEAISKIPVVDNILEVICRSTGMGFAAIARVTEDRWVACAVRDEINFGLVPGGELKIETTICAEIEKSKQSVIIDHVAQDNRFHDHHTPAMYGFQSYISTPIILQDGTFFGTLCAIDPRPNQLNTPETIGMFNLFAELIGFHLNALEQVEMSKSKLLEEQKTAELREQFIAILGHDLRNPVGAIRNSAQLLNRMPLEDRASRFVRIIQDSTFRITGLIENVLDFARGRLGGGLTLNRKPNEQLETTLVQVVTELETIWTDRTIAFQCNINGSVSCDAERIAQLFSNLLGNALTYGDPDTPVKVNATNEDNQFSLRISNSGKKIPDAAMALLFQPFSRGDVEKSKEGLGLGLYISSEIAKAHLGTLEVSSTEKETSFLLKFPS
ncbi:GAF domain-containing sensor histidine kinase [Pedobacter metabolipauper]|uniref:histidine kinase n=1 Tax=Pedobacter metabolipauper TaxID=425513 RepID=A0A4R6STZ7_9SPHI|nr:GAF domain-containing sensor histidine kinase [Pedobacter metabolipauper]TDQ07516.1 hypothetical protein ATK78_3643 [Pedobacter metabolipauper]